VTDLVLLVLVMAGATYLLRALPLVALRERIENPWLLSFLHYVPFAVLTAMTVPAILTATNAVVSGTVALLVAILVALRGRSLMTVALAAAAAVLVTEAVLALL